VLITSPDVSVPKGSYCGYHTHSTSIVAGTDIKYAFIPDPGPVHYDCSGNVAVYGDTTSPNGDIGMDSVADTLIHEVSETVTDPDLNAWFTKSGEEDGDLCNFVYGPTFIAANGSHANHTFGPNSYLVQEIWENTNAGFCAQSLP
jgi:Phosphate-induced protein 1 conserved region